MTVQYYNRSKLSEELSGGAKYVSFDELLKSSDVLSLNLPLNVSCLEDLMRVWILISNRNKHAISSPPVNSSK